MNFDWAQNVNIVNSFGGESTVLHVKKTGLFFFDALQLYGAIDLFLGIREDVSIHDAGIEWIVEGRARPARLQMRGERAYRVLRSGSIKPKPSRNVSENEYYEKLRAMLTSTVPNEHFSESLHLANGPFSGLDSAIQSGIRGTAAASYHTLQSGQSSDKVCIAQIPLHQGFLAFCGSKRTQSIGDIVFLPIFEGVIDLSKVISPTAAWVASPNPLCAQALMLLTLKTSLFAEGFQDRLTAVVYNKRVQRGDFAYSGVIAIDSTAISSKKMKSAILASDAYYALQRLMRDGWKNGKATGLEIHAFAMANWIMHPTGRNLSTMIASQERLHRDRRHHMLAHGHVKEIFNMSYEWKADDYETVRRFAKAVASGIFYARMKEVEKKDWGKAWFEEVTLLRSASSPRSFIRRAMYLVEKGHAKQSRIGTSEWDQSFEPQLLRIIGENRNEFESFRDLFRMYLVQESKPPERDEVMSEIETDTTDQAARNDRQEEEEE
jgi:hypothetical protein